MKNSRKFIAYALLLALSILSWFVFVPRTYDVPAFQARADTQYWNLSTGAAIGYTLVPAKGVKKPFPIIFLQGGPGGFISDRTIRMLAPLAEDGYDVYLYDQIGSGCSDRLANIREYTADRHVRDLEAIIQKIGVQKVILLGQSWGALLATLFVADHPGQVEKLILTGPGPIYPVPANLAAIEAPDSLHLRKALHSNRQANEKANNIRSKTMSWWATTFGVKLASDEEADDFQTLLGRELNKSTVCDTAKALKAMGGGGYYVQVMTVLSLRTVQDLRPKLLDSNIPLFIMRGQCDNQPWGAVAEYLTIFRHHELVIIPDAGHSISIEQPELYLRTLRGFLQQ